MAVVCATLLLLSQGLITPAKAWDCGNSQSCEDCLRNCVPNCYVYNAGLPPIFSPGCWTKCIDDKCQLLQQVRAPQCTGVADTDKCEECVNQCFMNCYKAGGSGATLGGLETCATSCAADCGRQ